MNVEKCQIQSFHLDTACFEVEDNNCGNDTVNYVAMAGELPTPTQFQPCGLRSLSGLAEAGLGTSTNKVVDL